MAQNPHKAGEEGGASKLDLDDAKYTMEITILKDNKQIADGYFILSDPEAFDIFVRRQKSDDA